MPLTGTGLSLGTPSYMSPEQATGDRDLDARSDVYALGAVTYEMLAGEPPVTGSRVQAMIAKLMTERPTSLRVLRDTVPEEVEDAVLTSLAKLPADRFASAAEFAAALQGQGTGPMRRVRPRGPAAQRPRPLLLGLLAATVAFALWGWLRPRPAPPSFPPSRLAIPTPTLGGSSTGLQRQVAITPDGSTILYTAVAEGGNYTMARGLDETEATIVPGIPQFVAGYAISQDGREFVATSFTNPDPHHLPPGRHDLDLEPRRTLRLLPVDPERRPRHLPEPPRQHRAGGVPRFASPKLGYTGVWLKDESAIVTAGHDPAKGGSRTDIGIIRNGGRGPIDPLVATRIEEQYPAVSPDDKWLAFARRSRAARRCTCAAWTGPGSRCRSPLSGGRNRCWGPNGRELFYRASNGSGVDLVMATLEVIPTVQVLSRRPALRRLRHRDRHAARQLRHSPDGKTFVMVRLNPASRIMVIQNLPGLVAKLRGALPSPRTYLAGS